MPPQATEPPVRIDVCVTCLVGQPPPEAGPRPGENLHAALAAELDRDESRTEIELHRVSCLASCAHGCAAVVSQPGKWSYLLGGLNAALATDLVTYLRAYRASKTGVLMPSKRPSSLAEAVLARIPSFVSSGAAAS
jgi:predicted metal-binding protein